MNPVIGIDLGTTNSVLARLDGGKPVAVSVYGETIVPSVVLFLDDRKVVGREARNLELQQPERAVRSSKRKMGSDHRYQIQGRSLAPEEIGAEVLAYLKRGAEETLGETIRDVVITVPAYFDDAQRRATLRAGELAGLNVLRLLNEPTAASLVYAQVESHGATKGVSVVDAGTPELILVYDLGGGTFDVSVLEVFDGVREVRSTTGNTQLGGDDFDDKLVQHFLEALKRTEAVDPREDPRAMARLRRIAEDTKIKLSSELTVDVREEFLTTKNGQPVHLNVQVQRREFEGLITLLLQSTVELAENALRDANVTAQELTRVCLVGGSTRIPMVRQLLRERFETDIHDEIDPDLAVALGAAVQSAIVQDVPVDRILVDVASHTLGLRVLGLDDNPWKAEPDTFAPIIARNTVLPASRTEEFYTMTDGQSQQHVEVFQGESALVSQNTPVGDFMTTLVPKPQGAPVWVTFEYDLNGVVRVTIQQPGEKPQNAVALSVSDAGRDAQKPSAAPASAVERKAATLLAQLVGEAREELQKLLGAYRSQVGEGKIEAEENLLDFFLDHDPDGDDRDPHREK